MDVIGFTLLYRVFTYTDSAFQHTVTDRYDVLAGMKTQEFFIIVSWPHHDQLDLPPLYCTTLQHKNKQKQNTLLHLHNLTANYGSITSNYIINKMQFEAKRLLYHKLKKSF